jgi:hypothetical protein
VTTLAELADQCQIALADSTETFWAQATIEGWVNEGLADISRFTCRIQSTTIACTDGVRKYELPAYFRRVVSVEYPAGETDPVYLERRSYINEPFWSDEGLYDIIDRRDAGNLAEVWISDTPSTGQSIIVEYHSTHESALDSGDTVTLLPHFHPLLVQYVYWRAHAERAAHEATDPTSSSSLLMAQLDQIAARAWDKYREMVLELCPGVNDV